MLLGKLLKMLQRVFRKRLPRDRHPTSCHCALSYFDKEFKAKRNKKIKVVVEEKPESDDFFAMRRDSPGMISPLADLPDSTARECFKEATGLITSASGSAHFYRIQRKIASWPEVSHFEDSEFISVNRTRDCLKSFNN